MARFKKFQLCAKGVPPPPFSMWPILGQTSWRHILQKRPPPLPARGVVLWLLGILVVR